MRMGEVMPCERRIHRGAFSLQFLDVIDRLLRQRESKAWHAGDLRGHLERDVAQAFAGHNAIDHAHLIRTRRIHPLAEKQKLLGDTRIQLIGVSKIFDARNAHPYHGIGKERIFRGDDQIAHPRQHQPASNAGALDHCDGRFRQIAPAAAHAEIYLLLPRVEKFAAFLVGVVVPQRRALERLVDIAARRADIVARRKMLARACQHDDLDGVVVRRAPERVVERVGHLRVLRVVILRTIHRDGGDAVGNLVLDHGFTHGRQCGLHDRPHARRGAGLLRTTLARRLCGSSARTMRRSSAVGAGVTVICECASNSKPVAS